MGWLLESLLTGFVLKRFKAPGEWISMTPDERREELAEWLLDQVEKLPGVKRLLEK